MCITFFTLRPQSGTSKNIEFLIAFNRDQHVNRETLQFAPFKEDPNIYAGRDLQSGGTWLGFNIQTGIFVFLTNFFYPEIRLGLSRGMMMREILDSHFLDKSMTREQIQLKIHSHLVSILKLGKQYSPFNLVIYSVEIGKMFYICSETEMKEPLQLKQGELYGLCNSQLFDLLPKTAYGLQIYKEVINELETRNNEEFMEFMLTKLMWDRKSFSEDPVDQSPIFLQKFYSTLWETDRMTKSTFLGIIQKNTEKYQIHAKQLTYDEDSSVKSTVELKLDFI